MGKAEQLKQQRRIMELQQKQTRSDKNYRNKLLAYGFGAGLVVGIVVMLPFALHRSQPAALQFGSLSKSPNPNVTIPSNLQLPQQGSAAATPLALPQ